MQSEKEEAEDIIPGSLRDAKTPQLIMMKKKKKRHHEKKSCFNPYSTFGLDKFTSLSAELSAKREYVSRKTGIPEAKVRFAYTSKGLVPVVLKTDYDGRVSKLSGLLRPRTKHGSQFKENYNSNPQEDGYEGDHDVEGDEGCENGVNGSESRKEGGAVTILPWWSRYLETTAFVVQKVSAILTSKFSVPAAAMAVVLLVGFLQRMCLGAVMGMKRFKDRGIFHFFEHLIYTRTSPEFRTRHPEKAEQVEKPLTSPEHKISNEERLSEGSLISLSALSNPTVRFPASFSVPAVAMAVFVLVGSLQTMCLGAVMGMKRFIDKWIFHFFEHLIDLKTSPEFRTRPPEDAEQVEKPLPSPEHKITNEERFSEGSLISLNALRNPTLRYPASLSASKNGSRSLNFNTGQKGKKKNKTKFGRIFYIDGQPGKTNRVQQSEDFLGRAKRRPIDTTVGATLMAIILFVLVIYGRLCAICFTSALLCIVPKLRNGENITDSGTNYKNSTVMMDLQSREYRKKVIMDGLLDRSHLQGNTRFTIN
ncbi:hypothetical protein SUGI_0575230 [Cryptomeria japonica]|uniref:uncharacterized protein LOC131044753 n=1 Tax=Cryptomeria japonica TaxID=3369 RepID=UPI002408F1BE|nr:uncharacterized protein LOC131044753 [Cryptomeria japonica]GLJ29175.1 hypothetical protein SUGI_0575230 [Cryptomeria japonica]